MNTIVEEQIAQTIVQEDVDAVTRGALFLDEHLPGWANDIDLEYFRIEDGASCICGQLEMTDRVDSGWFVRHTPSHLPYDPTLGFATKCNEVDGVTYLEMEWTELQARWTDEILERQHA